ncbi:MAG: extracellular solute-binding protein [Oscillospiraceae bacterium]|jgi:putative aldouronate transport system substrate-binding protein|nr:extracellular solute-binding protein [Oscillospiraceae bacterium]
MTLTKRLLAAVVAVVTLCSMGAAVSAETVKPETITFFIDTVFGSMMLDSTFQPVVDAFKEATGITIKFIKPDHSVYYDQLNLAFASGDIPDLMEIGSTNYPTYASNGALWDMTSAWEGSALRASGAVKDENYVNALKIEGKLYGFPLSMGNGTITYIRQDWLDNLGLTTPANYDEFVETLRAFTEDDPDGNGVDDTFGITAPGLINGETPYDIYLREFYQDAKPDIYQNADGAWVDGMQEPQMLDALYRLRDVYQKGYMDVEVITNNTSAAREKFYAGQTGTFNYWAGNWNVTIENNTRKNFPDASVKPIPPTGGIYIERPSLALAISNACANPEGVFEYLISYAYDGAEGQTLFTRGIEGIHYVKEGDAYKQLPDPENTEKLFEKVIAAPDLVYTSWADPIKLDERVLSSKAMFMENRRFDPVPPASAVWIENISEVIPIRKEAIALAVTDEGVTPEQAIADYVSQAQPFIDAILAERNGK